MNTLMIKDLTESKELDREAMSEVHGGGDITSNMYQNSAASSTAGLVAITDTKQSQFALNQAIDQEWLEKTQVVIGANELVFN